MTPALRALVADWHERSNRARRSHPGDVTIPNLMLKLAAELEATFALAEPAPPPVAPGVREALELLVKRVEDAVGKISDPAMDAARTALAASEPTPPLIPDHDCEALLELAPPHLGENRSFSVGRITRPPDNFPHEQWCFHVKTPIKPEIVFCLNEGDLTHLAVAIYVALGYHVNKEWIERMASRADAPPASDDGEGAPLPAWMTEPEDRAPFAAWEDYKGHQRLAGITVPSASDAYFDAWAKARQRYSRRPAPPAAAPTTSGKPPFRLSGIDMIVAWNGEKVFHFADAHSAKRICGQLNRLFLEAGAAAPPPEPAAERYQTYHLAEGELSGGPSLAPEPAVQPEEDALADALIRRLDNSLPTPREEDVEAGGDNAGVYILEEATLRTALACAVEELAEAAAPPEDRWRAVSDELPEPGTSVYLVWRTFNGPNLATYDERVGRTKWWSLGVSLFEDVTHWRPLPPPPAGLAQEGE